jgi:hypothetical protein
MIIPEFSLNMQDYFSGRFPTLVTAYPHRCCRQTILGRCSGNPLQYYRSENQKTWEAVLWKFQQWTRDPRLATSSFTAIFFFHARFTLKPPLPQTYADLIYDRLRGFRLCRCCPTPFCFCRITLPPHGIQITE